MPSNDLYEDIHASISGNGSAIRAEMNFEPAGGQQSKINPSLYIGGEYASYGKKDNEGKFESENVIVNSVAAESNRAEMALLAAYQEGKITFPDVLVHIKSKQRSYSTIELPHRIFDSVIRDSKLNDERFGYTDLGEKLANTSLANNTWMFHTAPTSLVFGFWDSQGTGSKSERLYVSEIEAKDVYHGKAPGGRLDPLVIEKESGTLYESSNPEIDGPWTLDPKKAVLKSNKPVLYKKKGTPAEAVHGHIPPSFKEKSGKVKAGGVFAESIVQTAVFNVTHLKKMKFPNPETGERIPEEEHAYRMVLATLGIAAYSLMFDFGFDLRSRCLLIPMSEPELQFIGRTTQDVTRMALTTQDALQAYEYAVAQLKKLGLPWNCDPICLQASADLETLVANSDRHRKFSSSATGEDS